LNRFEVALTEYAALDLAEIIEYIAAHDDAARAAHVLDGIEEVLEGLATLPERGSHPKELLALGIREYRQAFFKPYRLIYQVIARRVYVYLIVDGRRDMESVLARRLLRG
jgi:toxin ParE1/3/4